VVYDKYKTALVSDPSHRIARVDFLRPGENQRMRSGGENQRVRSGDAVFLLYRIVYLYAIFQCPICFFQDLCERHEKGVLNDHQRALQKMGQYKKKKMSATVGGTETGAVEQLEQRILQVSVQKFAVGLDHTVISKGITV
jgi:hypothetical protein